MDIKEVKECKKRGECERKQELKHEKNIQYLYKEMLYKKEKKREIERELERKGVSCRAPDEKAIQLHEHIPLSRNEEDGGEERGGGEAPQNTSV